MASQFYTVAIPLIKTAIMVEWIRVFVPSSIRNWFWWVCVLVMVVQLGFGAAAVIAESFVCIPYEKIWYFWLPGKCFNQHHIEITSAAVQIFSDVAILILPQKTIWGLQMSWQKRLGISALFSLGLM